MKTIYISPELEILETVEDVITNSPIKVEEEQKDGWKGGEIW